MKKRNLILSVICSAALVVLLVAFSIVDVIGLNKKPSNNPSGGSNVNDSSNTNNPGQTFDPSINEGEDKGSKENPYYIYDVETFTNLLSTYGSKQREVEKVVLNEKGEPVKTIVIGEDGKAVYVDQLDEEGNPVLDEDGNVKQVLKLVDKTEIVKEPYNFKIINNINFSGRNYVTLFNKDEAFIGNIDGDGHTVSGITINVTLDNLKDYAYAANGDATFHIGVFGTISGATIENVSFNGLSITVAHEVYKEIKEGDLNREDKLGAFPQELTIGGVAALAVDSKISANVTATIDADAYSVYANSSSQGANALGGVVGAMVNSTITSSKVDVDFIADSDNRNYYLGGVAGYMANSTIEKTTVNANVTAVSAPNQTAISNRLYIAGIAGFATGANITETEVTLDVAQTESTRYNTNGVNQVDNTKFNIIAGIAATVRADGAENTTNISKVTVHSNVDMDGFYAGAIYTVSNKDYEDSKTVHAGDIYITIEDTILDSNVNTLKAYGVGAQLLYTEIKYSEKFAYAWTNANGESVQYAVKLTGDVRLRSNRNVESLMYVAAIVSANENNGTTGWNKTLKYDYKALKVVMSKSIAFEIVLTQKVDIIGGVLV